MRRFIVALALVALSLIPAPATAQYQVVAVYNGAWTTCTWYGWCFPMNWQYILFADGTFNYNDSTGYTYTGWY